MDLSKVIICEKLFNKKYSCCRMYCGSCQSVEKGHPKGWFFLIGYGIIKRVIKMLQKDKKERN
ncbi:MAG: hypothetical protein J6A37_17320, partial [Oscillospiraceae bacterium]|nr:hypothetical protein [Oscillospiraceae bacterium]